MQNPVVELDEDGLVLCRTSDLKGELWYDILTGRWFEDKPSVVNVKWLSFMKVNDECRPRLKMAFPYVSFREEDLKVYKDVFQQKDIESSRTIFIHRNNAEYPCRLIGFTEDHEKVLRWIYPRADETFPLFYYKDGKMLYQPLVTIRDRSIHESWLEKDRALGIPEAQQRHDYDD